MRRAIQSSQESLIKLAKRYAINPKTVHKWRKHSSVADTAMGPKPRSTVLSVEQEAIIIAFRKHTLLPLDDCLYALQATIPKLTRSALHRCWVRHGIEHRLTKPNHPWTNGQVERMNRTIKETTVRTCHYDGHAQLREHLAAFLNAYNFAKRLKTLAGLTSYLFICSCGQKEPGRFISNPHRLSAGLNS